MPAMYVNETVRLSYAFRSAALATSTVVAIAGTPSQAPTDPTVAHRLVALDDSIISDRLSVMGTSSRSSRTLRRPLLITPVAATTTPISRPPDPAGDVTSHPFEQNRGDIALQFAIRQIGKPYRLRSSGPRSFDCSGLTMAAWNEAGAELPHNAAAQYRNVMKITRSELVPGDLVFFYHARSHVGVYAGHGQIIDAPRPGRRIALRSMGIMPIVGYGRPSTG